MLEIFEQHNGPAIKHRLFAGVLKGGPPTEKGKRGAIRDAIQDALFRRHKRGVAKSHKPYFSDGNDLDIKRVQRQSLRRNEKVAHRTRRKK